MERFEDQGGRGGGSAGISDLLSGNCRGKREAMCTKGKESSFLGDAELARGKCSATIGNGV